MQEALQEADYLIAKRLVWVHTFSQDGNPHEHYASLVAYTRNCSQVSTITKVVTHPQWRRKGCAERLTRKVTHQ
jgi:ribosomal protein S18 acetylase RimI-like enzyme